MTGRTHYRDYYNGNFTFMDRFDDRLMKVIHEARDLHPNMVLDIGCGSGVLLGELRKLTKTMLLGVEIAEEAAIEAGKQGLSCVVAEVSSALPLRTASVEMVIMGEVIEHLVDPDAALKEIHRVLRSEGVLILTTPNLAAWYNRFLLLFGIQPIYTETSLHRNLGRRFGFLGQGRKAQGHLKVFTLGALLDILKHNGFQVIKVRGSYLYYLPKPLNYLDMIMCSITDLSSGLIAIARKMDDTAT